MKERTKSTIAVIIIGALLLLAGYVEVKAEVCHTVCDPVGDAMICTTICY
jgi:hypothetical protein